jgi:hypothetical protein
MVNAQSSLKGFEMAGHNDYSVTYYTPFASGGENAHESRHGSLARATWAYKQAWKNNQCLRVEVRKYSERTGEYEPFHLPRV